jgi:hypothetical protein
MSRSQFSRKSGPNSVGAGAGGVRDGPDLQIAGAGAGTVRDRSRFSWSRNQFSVPGPAPGTIHNGIDLNFGIKYYRMHEKNGAGSERGRSWNRK